MQRLSAQRDPDAVQLAKKLLRRLSDDGDQREIDLKTALERFIAPPYAR